MNPYTPPTASLDPGPAGGAVSAERAAEVQKEIKRLNAFSFLLGVPGLVLQAGGQAWFPGILGTLVVLLGTALLVGGLVFYARLRGRSPGWAGFGLLSCIGLLVLYFLPKFCLNCRGKQSFSATRCTRCAAPLGS